jgi:5'-3' exoribonuclease 1
MGITDESVENKKLLNVCIENYIQSLYFTLQYYYIGCPSWGWHYHFRIAPLLGDVYHYLNENDIKTIELK